MSDGPAESGNSKPEVNRGNAYNEFSDKFYGSPVVRQIGFSQESSPNKESGLYAVGMVLPVVEEIGSGFSEDIGLLLNKANGAKSYVIVFNNGEMSWMKMVGAPPYDTGLFGDEESRKGAPIMIYKELGDEHRNLSTILDRHFKKIVKDANWVGLSFPESVEDPDFKEALTQATAFASRGIEVAKTYNDHDEAQWQDKAFDVEKTRNGNLDFLASLVAPAKTPTPALETPALEPTG